MLDAHMKRGQIYLVDLGDTAGSEVKKIRPCIVVQNDIGNKFAPTTIVIPITHRGNRQQPTQVEITKDLLTSDSEKVDGMALAEQVRTIDRSRIRSLIGSLNFDGVKLLENAILNSMGIKRALIS